MRRGLKPCTAAVGLAWTDSAARAAPYEKGTETWNVAPEVAVRVSAARAAPYEKGTETHDQTQEEIDDAMPRARPPMRRGLKRFKSPDFSRPITGAARAAPYEKGTETYRSA